MENLLSRVFDLRAINLDLDNKTKEKAFVELIDSIADFHPECNRSELFTAIREREEKMNTGIGNGVAIPHISYRGIGKITGAIGISRHGIDYGAMDNIPVQVIFLLITGDHPEENHLLVMNHILKLIQSEAFLLIKNAKNAQDIHAILTRN